jgi:hypothetical protein
MDEIVLDRGESHNVMKLDQSEEDLLSEIQISDEPAPRPARKATAPKRPTFNRTPPVYEDVEAFGNPNKAQPPKRPQPEFVNHGQDEEEYEDENEQYEQYGESDNGEEEMPSPGYGSIEDEKADILNKLTRLEKKGHHTNKKLTIYSDINELRSELKRIMYGIETEQSIRFSRRMLIACVTGVEFLNKRYNPFDLALDGWSESVMENVDDYDGVFEELYHKYKTKMHVAPEVKLIMMLGGSAMMFHLTNSMFKAAIPNMNDVMKQNPDLVKNMMDAVKNTTAGGSREDPTQRPTQPDTFDSAGRREMQGPGLDLSSLMGGIMMPPPPVSTTLTPVMEEVATVEDDLESISDIVSVSGESTGGEVKNVSVTGEKKKRGRKSKKNEVSL